MLVLTHFDLNNTIPLIQRCSLQVFLVGPPVPARATTQTFFCVKTSKETARRVPILTVPSEQTSLEVAAEPADLSRINSAVPDLVRIKTERMESALARELIDVKTSSQVFARLPGTKYSEREPKVKRKRLATALWLR